MNASELARKANVSRATVSLWLNGQTQQLEGENLTRAASALGVDAHWLATGEGTAHPKKTARPSSTHNVEPGPNITGMIPLISWVQAGAWREVIDNFAPGFAEEWLPCPVCHSPSTFVLRVRGESMFNPYGRPSFQEGDLIYVDPERPAEHGSLVIVRLDDEKEATFKKLVIEGEKKYLKALNPAWPDPIIQVNGNATICGVIIFKGEKL